MNEKQGFYKKAVDYWAHIPATLDGMLGGFGYISDIDIEGSKVFLNWLFLLNDAPSHSRALDCGAGIGRVTKYLLLPNFEIIDVVEQDEKFIAAVRDFIGPNSRKIGDLYQIGLQDFEPQKTYDVIWSQWVLGHLNDEDLVLFLKKCRNALAPNGVIVVKENVTSSGKLEVDEVDSSVTRSLKMLLKIFQKAKLDIIKEVRQKNFPDGIYPVYMFALRPLKETETEGKDKKLTSLLVNAVDKINVF